jgi:hypothetical protein
MLVVECCMIVHNKQDTLGHTGTTIHWTTRYGAVPNKALSRTHTNTKNWHPARNTQSLGSGSPRPADRQQYMGGGLHPPLLFLVPASGALLQPQRRACPLARSKGLLKSILSNESAVDFCPLKRRARLGTAAVNPWAAPLGGFPQCRGRR